jgi:hypothetical protein
VFLSSPHASLSLSPPWPSKSPSFRWPKSLEDFRRDHAARDLSAWLKRAKGALSPYHPLYAEALELLALRLCREQPVKAVKYARHALKLFDKILPPLWPRRVPVLVALILALRVQVGRSHFLVFFLFVL